MQLSLEKIFTSGKKIAFVGGGTGGHIEPILSIYKAFYDLRKYSIWIGGNESNEEIKARKERLAFFSIQTLKLATTKSPRILLYPFILIWGIYRSIRILRENNTEIVFSKGGPGSVAVGIAAWISNIPLYIHESDTVPGISNRILGKFAQKIFLGFEVTKKYLPAEKCETIGQILDPIFSEKRENIKTSIWKTQRKHIFVICGSQGSRSIFEEIIQNCRSIDAEWIISLGNLNTGMRELFSDFKDSQLFDWIEKDVMINILSDTDICITRGSATTLAEIEVFQVPKIIIPLPEAAGNHQYYNAVEYQKMGHILLEQKNLNTLTPIITQIINHGNNRNQKK